MFPALRIGFVVFPRNVISQAQGALHELLRGGHRIEQLALADFIGSGEFGRHLGRMRRLYRERQHVLREALARHFAGSPILGGNAGMHLTLCLPPHVDDRAVAAHALARGIAVHALSTFSLGPTAHGSGLVIGYGNTRTEEIAGAVSVLAQLVRDAAP
jgi:GntR family transcriptional regulator/MocR family aminotransferase